ncbi:hypothetical protein VARIO8X_70123 [Burkholderiales bacterium 8X]|nr:hypothetical protein VARIO8X_70123 [Burkholderiales bacterium 8X]
MLRLPPTGGNTCGPAEPVPRGHWTRPQGFAHFVCFAYPLPGAAPAARRSRFRGVLDRARRSFSSLAFDKVVT